MLTTNDKNYIAEEIATALDKALAEALEPIKQDILFLKAEAGYARHHISKLYEEVAAIRSELKEVREDITILKEGMILLLERTACLDDLKTTVQRHDRDIDLLKRLSRA